MPLHRAELQGHAAVRDDQAHAPRDGHRDNRVRLVWASAAEGQRWPRRSTSSWTTSAAGPAEMAGQLAGRRASRLEALEEIVHEHAEAMEVPAMSDHAKGKLAIYWAASCGGCEISILADRREDPRRGGGLRHRAVALRHRRQGPRRGEDGRRRASTSASSTAASAPASRNTWPNSCGGSRRSWWPSAPAPAKAASPAWATSTRGKRFSRRSTRKAASTPRTPDVRPQPRNQDARRHAPPAGVLRHAEDAGPDGGGRLLSARLPAGGRPHLGGDGGHPRGQAAAEGLGNRRRTPRSATNASGSGTRRRSRSSTAPGR